MVDPATLGVIAATLAGKALERLAEKAADGAADAAEGGVAQLLSWVRQRFAGRKELASLQDAPDSPSRVKALARAIDVELDAHPPARAELQEILNAIDRAGSNTYSVRNIVAYQGGVAAAHIEGQVNAGYGPGQPEAEGREGVPRPGSGT